MKTKRGYSKPFISDVFSSQVPICLYYHRDLDSCFWVSLSKSWIAFRQWNYEQDPLCDNQNEHSCLMLKCRVNVYPKRHVGWPRRHINSHKTRIQKLHKCSYYREATSAKYSSEVIINKKNKVSYFSIWSKSPCQNSISWQLRLCLKKPSISLLRKYPLRHNKSLTNNQHKINRILKAVTV